MRVNGIFFSGTQIDTSKMKCELPNLKENIEEHSFSDIHIIKNKQKEHLEIIGITYHSRQ